MPGALGAARDDIPRSADFGVVIGAGGAVGTVDEDAVGPPFLFVVVNIDDLA